MQRVLIVAYMGEMHHWWENVQDRITSVLRDFFIEMYDTPDLVSGMLVVASTVKIHLIDHDGLERVRIGELKAL